MKFVRHIPDYADIIYDKPLSEFFKDKLEMVQYNAILVITGAIKASRDRIYRGLGLESLAERRWPRQSFFFHKVISGLLPVCIQSYISYCGEGVYRRRSADQKNLRQLSTRTRILESSFFPYCIKEWNNLNEELWKIESTVQFKTKILSFIRPK